MIVPDVNLLVYAYNADAPAHAESKAWWEDLMAARTPIGIPWAVSIGYVRLMTHPSVVTTPLSPATAVGDVRSWLDRDHVIALDPGPQHLSILERALAAAGTAGRLTSDAHLAAIAIEHQAELHSNDVDFSRFPGLRWVNPLAPT